MKDQKNEKKNDKLVCLRKLKKRGKCLTGILVARSAFEALDKFCSFKGL